MRIPTNSNFSREIAKKLQRIINPQTTLEELQNLQDEMKMINPVDTHLLNQVSQIKEKKKVTAWKLHQIKYHQVTL